MLRVAAALASGALPPSLVTSTSHTFLTPTFGSGGTTNLPRNSCSRLFQHPRL